MYLENSVENCSVTWCFLLRMKALLYYQRTYLKSFDAELNVVCSKMFIVPFLELLWKTNKSLVLDKLVEWWGCSMFFKEKLWDFEMTRRAEVYRLVYYTIQIERDFIDAIKYYAIIWITYFLFPREISRDFFSF